MHVRIKEQRDGTNVVTVSIGKSHNLESSDIGSFLLANVDSPDVWDSVREVLATGVEQTIGGGAEPVTIFRKRSA